MLQGTKIRNESHLYNYKFDELAPYEVYENDDLSQEEFQKFIKVKKY